MEGEHNLRGILTCIAPWIDKQESMFNHNIHIDKKSENQIVYISATLNTITDMIFD